jgi:hypothetical protein
VEEISPVEVRVGQYLVDGEFWGKEVVIDGSEVGGRPQRIVAR